MRSIFPIQPKYIGIGWAALIIVAGVVMASPASAVESGGIGGRPAKPDPNNSRTESIFVFDLAAGSTAKNVVKIFNNSGTEKTIGIYAVDSQISSGGSFACAQKVEEKRDVGSWIKLDKNIVTLPAAGSEEIGFTLVVPVNAPGGEHNGCIVIQEENQTPVAAGNGIALSFRSAIRVAATIDGDLKKGLQFTKLDTRRDKGDKRIITPGLRNSGNVSLDTDIDARIKSVFGTTVRKTGGEFPILAGGESEFNFDTTEPFWGGVYFLTAKAHYNSDPAAGLGKGEKSASITKTQILLTTPKPLAAVTEALVFLAVVGGGAYFWRRRRQHKQWRTIGKVYVVKEGETLQQIAERFSLPWKTIARINQLKAPYHLEAGDRLRLLPKFLESEAKTKVKKKAKR